MRHRFTEPTPVGSTEILTIRIAAFEIECCAPPPRVGEQSTWQLLAGEYRGSLWGTAHGGQLIARTVSGTVLSVHIMTESFQLADDRREWLPIPGTVRLTRVHQSPTSFRDTNTPFDATECTSRTGIVIELAVPREQAPP